MNKNLYEFLHEALNNLGFKVRNKQDLVDIAGALGANTLKTKDGLLSNIAKKLSDILTADFKDYDIAEIHVSNLINAIKNKGLPKNMEPLIKEILIETKKIISKKTEKTKNNITTPITGMYQPNYNNNSMYSYSPTVQNYNFMYNPYSMQNYPYMPLFPFGNMNYKGTQYQNPYFNHNFLSSMQQMKPPQMPVNPTEFNMSNFNNLTGLQQQINLASSMINPQNVQQSQINQHHIPTNNEKVIKQAVPPLATPYFPTSSTPIPKPFSNEYFDAYNKMLQNLQSRSNQQLPTLIKPPSQTIIQPPPVELKTKQGLYLRESKQSKINKQQQKNAQSSPLQKVPCICHSRGKGQTLKCYHCSNLFHTQCLNIGDWNKRQKDNFQCPKCTIRRVDPLHQVKAIFFEQIINFRTSPRFERAIKIQNFIQQIIPQDFLLEVRSIRLNGKNNYQISWPDYGILETGNRTVEFKPLQSNSSMKKRKDEIIAIDKVSAIKNKTIPFKIEVKVATRQLQKTYRIRDQGFFLIGVYLVKKINAEDLIEKLITSQSLQLTSDQSKQKLMRHFNENDDICLEKLTMKLYDPILLTKIKIPGRGIFCQHPQCFGLDTFIQMMSRLQHRSWKCPLCNYRCTGLYKDTYIQEILKSAPEDKHQVQFYPSGEFNLVNEKKQQDSDSQPIVPNKKQPIQEVIIDDDDVIIISKEAVNLITTQIQHCPQSQPLPNPQPQQQPQCQSQNQPQAQPQAQAQLQVQPQHQPLIEPIVQIVDQQLHDKKEIITQEKNNFETTYVVQNLNKIVTPNLIIESKNKQILPFEVIKQN